MAGSLYLLPVQLGPADTVMTHPPGVLASTQRLDYFIVERAKTARADLRKLGHPAQLASLTIEELPAQAEKLDQRELDRLLAPVLAGRDGGLMSEAGCPAVADPGALVVRRAHERGIRVVPHVGPSSLLLALMASGLNGQCFRFHGYLPVQAEARQRSIAEIEAESARRSQTELFIETPYRNIAMLDALLLHLKDSTQLCVASGLTTAEERITTRNVADWKLAIKQAGQPDLDRQPAIFLLLAMSRGDKRR
ncbi:SAM-dependent methyltransferase [Uliginosibacterium sp. H1]|uniref:SAM-dependent methyltransferase n=1 Tax=Uliginosibacterium sp. H1 TaxID=3114757 RepID=UPI002E19D2B6|nr:SAM-dependent methyltransferase [Uliginosibacterium sp. H1]